MNMDLNEVVKLQEAYQQLLDTRKLTKKAMCDLVIPFRDKYKLTDLEALRIARNEIGLSELALLMQDK